MMEGSFFKQELFLSGLGLVLGLPILVLVLGELIERLERWGNPLVQGVRQLRHVVLPILATLFIMQYILSMMGTEASVRLVATLFWLTVIYAALTVVRNLVQLGEANPASWVAKVPTLFFALARGVVLFWLLSHILSGIWGIDLSKLGTVLGVGSLAIALALQDTIGNIVSGFLMLANRPFQVNDWIQVGGEWMEVQEVDWRTTRLTNFVDGGSVMIPNGTLANQKIINYGQEGSLHQLMMFFTFTYDDPPNIVKTVLADVLGDIQGVLSKPAPSIIAYGYSEFGIRYRLTCWIDFWDWVPVWDAVHTKVFYAARRHGLTLSRPIEFQGDLDTLKPQIASHQIAGMLRANPLFASFDTEAIDGLVTGTAVRDYAAGEAIVHQGEPDEGFYVIQTGEIDISVRDGAGQPQDIAHLQASDFFGEMALLRNEPSPISATATTDVHLLVIDGPLITHLIETNPQFALEMNFFLEKRQITVNTITGKEDGKAEQTVHRDWIDMVKRL